MCGQRAVASLLLPWLRCGGFSVPLLLTHVGVLQLGLVQGDLERHLGDECEKAKYRSPAIAASSAPKGCPPYSLRSLEENHQSHRVRFWTGQRFHIPSFWYQHASSVHRQQRLLTTVKSDLLLLIKLKVDRRSREEENYPHRSFCDKSSEPGSHPER